MNKLQILALEKISKDVNALAAKGAMIMHKTDHEDFPDYKASNDGNEIAKESLRIG